MAKHVLMSTEGMEESREESGAVFNVTDEKAGVIGDLTVSTAFGGVRSTNAIPRSSSGKNSTSS